MLSIYMGQCSSSVLSSCDSLRVYIFPLYLLNSLGIAFSLVSLCAINTQMTPYREEDLLKVEELRTQMLCPMHAGFFISGSFVCLASLPSNGVRREIAPVQMLMDFSMKVECFYSNGALKAFQFVGHGSVYL